MRRSGSVLLVLLIGLALGVAATLAVRMSHWWRADPETIAAASLQSMRQENRLTVFVARYVAVVTSEEGRFGLSARKTLIMPGTVRYDLDLARLDARDLRWDGAAKTLSVTLPPVVASPPAVELAAIREYSSGGVLMVLTDAEKTLDAANRSAGVRELAAQSRTPFPMKMARDAGVAAIERSFAMPLRAAGIDAGVVVRFADQPS